MKCQNLFAEKQEKYFKMLSDSETDLHAKFGNIKISSL